MHRLSMCPCLDAISSLLKHTHTHTHTTRSSLDPGGSKTQAESLLSVPSCSLLGPHGMKRHSASQNGCPLQSPVASDTAVTLQEPWAFSSQAPALHGGLQTPLYLLPDVKSVFNKHCHWQFKNGRFLLSMGFILT